MQSLHTTPAAISASVAVPVLAWHATPAPVAAPASAVSPAAVPIPTAEPAPSFQNQH